MNSSAAGNLYKARMGPNSNTKTPEITSMLRRLQTVLKRGDATTW